MATKKAGSRLETEIERCRSECQWERIPELVKQLSAKLIANDDMAELLLGESKLEQFLKENALKQSSSPRGPRPKLTEVRKHLTAALDRGNLKPEFLQEANLLMAKLNYVEGDYKEALNTYARVGVDDLQLAAVPPYRLRMIAEAYSTKVLGSSPPCNVQFHELVNERPQCTSSVAKCLAFIPTREHVQNC